MEIAFLIVVIFLFLLAVFDLSVGVGNDAVNFLNSAIGSKAASFKRVLLVASAGVFIGAAMSNGMMDIARHGIFRPEHFSFYELMCIFMAVMVTDIILLDIFNSLGMPTSTTVSMVFELLGASFIVALFKMSGGIDLGLNDLLNTEKALSVILGIFLSVAIAFVFGTLVQFLTRVIFHIRIPQPLEMENRYLRGLMFYGDCIFPVDQGNGKPHLYDRRSESMDFRQYGANRAVVLRFLCTFDAAFTPTQDKCVEGDSVARNILARNGFCR